MPGFRGSLECNPDFEQNINRRTLACRILYDGAVAGESHYYVNEDRAPASELRPTTAESPNLYRNMYRNAAVLTNRRTRLRLNRWKCVRT
jgi:hypothetical protein